MSTGKTAGLFNNFKIGFDVFTSSRSIIQCFNCQRVGHGISALTACPLKVALIANSQISALSLTVKFYC